MFKILQYFLISLSFISCNAFAKVPLESFKCLVKYSWENDASICIVSQDNYSFTIGGQGFQPNEVLDMQSLSGNEILNFSLTTEQNGCFQAGILPAVIGKKSGVAKLIVKRRNNPQIGTLTYYWNNPYDK